MVEGVIHREHSISIVMPPAGYRLPGGGPRPDHGRSFQLLRWESREMGTDEPRRPRLTKRETEVLWLIALGHTDESIAVVLGNRRTTISNHVSSILKKLNATSRAAAVWQGVVLNVLVIEPGQNPAVGNSARCSCGEWFHYPFESALIQALKNHMLREHKLDLTDAEIREMRRGGSDSN